MAASSDTKTLEKRAAYLEPVLHSEERNQDLVPHASVLNGSFASCNLPTPLLRPRDADISDLRESLIAYSERKWANGTHLRYYLYDHAPYEGSASNAKLVREAFGIWQDLGIGLVLEETKIRSEAELRISFIQDGRAWSFVGTDCLHKPKQHEPTMNIGWEMHEESRGIDTALHEIGHALGFPHEHQNPHSGLVWNETAVLETYSGSPNYWDEKTIRHNILSKHSPTELQGSEWDPNSIMHYAFGPGVISKPPEFASGLVPEGGLSDTDKAEVLKFYPPLSAHEYQVLIPFQSDVLNLQPAEQKNYLLRLEETRTYHIQAIGSADMLLVLFRRDGDRKVYMGGANDAGTDGNAEFDVRLERGQEYELGARLISNCDRHAAGVIFW